MDLTLNPEEQTVLEDARAAAPHLAARAAEADRAMRFPAEDLDDLRRHNLLALAVPKEYGGRGATVAAYVLACETLAAADASVAIAWVMHTACAWEIARTAQPSTRRATVDGILRNGHFICIAGAEGRGPDGAPRPLRATRQGDSWRLDGAKGFASGSEAATWVFTNGTDPDENHQSFLVRMDAPGLTITDRWDGMGMRASASHGLSFDGCIVPEAYHLTQSYKTGDFRNTSALFGLGLAATALGIAQAALDFAVDWCRARNLNDLSRARLGDMDVRVEAVRSLIGRAAAHADADPKAAEPWVDRAKTMAVEAGQQVTLDAMRVCGGNGFRQRYPLERHARDAMALLLQGQRPDMLRVGLANLHLTDANAPAGHHPTRPR